MDGMRVYINGRLCFVETNLAWAVPYWNKRKLIRPDLNIKLEA